MENDTQTSRVLLGAALGAGFAFLFLTKSGRRLLDSADPWLDDVIRDIQRFRGAAAKAKEAVDEGRRSFAEISKLTAFGNQGRDWSAESNH